jgi:trimethylamine:corrinoid methyltransferase-like protein
MPSEVDGSETIHNVGNLVAFYPPGGTPRLSDRQDARRHGTMVRYANVNMYYQMLLADQFKT